MKAFSFNECSRSEYFKYVCLKSTELLLLVHLTEAVFATIMKQEVSCVMDNKYF